MNKETRAGIEPSCPFCDAPLARPVQIRISSFETAIGGTCRCGAIYILDPTSKNVGEVMMQGLSMAAAQLSKDSSDMLAGDDYDDIILSYDWRRHRSSGEAKNYMDGYGRLYVIKVKNKN